MKRTYNKREIITDMSFDFTKQKLQWHIECVQTRMKYYKTAANDIVKMISIIYSWTILNFCTRIKKIIKYSYIYYMIIFLINFQKAYETFFRC